MTEQIDRDIARLNGLIDRWDTVPSGPDAFAVHHEIMAYLLEGSTSDPCNWLPLRRLVDAAEASRLQKAQF